MSKLLPFVFLCAPSMVHATVLSCLSAKACTGEFGCSSRVEGLNVTVNTQDKTVAVGKNLKMTLIDNSEVTSIVGLAGPSTGIGMGAPGAHSFVLFKNNEFVLTSSFLVSGDGTVDKASGISWFGTCEESLS